ncbi:MAG: hypothetical protein P1R58_03195 [bacterium]|nr:hypothetical protein [bacterium]
MTKVIFFFGVLIILTLLLIGCGYNPDEPLYDVAANPENFPEAALALISEVDSDQVLDVEQVVTQFVDLYSSHQELLDNHEWKELVNRMGHKLRIKADKLAVEGIENYMMAADHYQLASFARPGDERLQKTSERYECWRNYDRESIIQLAAAIGKDGFTLKSLQEIIESLKRFAYTDSVHFEFAQQLLVEPLLKTPYRQNPKSSDLLDSLSAPERNFLACWELVRPDYDHPVCSFESPEIDLVSFEIYRMEENRYRAEFYFLPAKSLDKDLTVAFWVDSENDPVSQSDRPLSMSLPFDFHPLPPTQRWSGGRMVAAVREFECSDGIGRISLGLYQNDQDQVVYMPITGISGNLIRLPATPHKLPVAGSR